MNIIMIVTLLAVVGGLITWRVSRRTSSSSSSVRCQQCSAPLPVKESGWGVPAIRDGGTTVYQDVYCKKCHKQFRVERPMTQFEYFVYWPNQICEFLLSYTEKALQSNPKDGGLWLLRGCAYKRCEKEYLYKNIWHQHFNTLDTEEADRKVQECFDKLYDLKRNADGSFPCDFYEGLILSDHPGHSTRCKEANGVLAVLYMQVTCNKVLDKAQVASLIDAVNRIEYKTMLGLY